jgi:hypothetical protein
LTVGGVRNTEARRRFLPLLLSLVSAFFRFWPPLLLSLLWVLLLLLLLLCLSLCLPLLMLKSEEKKAEVGRGILVHLVYG